MRPVPTEHPRAPAQASRHVLLFALLLLAIAYVFPRWADWNQNSRFDQVVAAVDDGTMQIDAYVENTGDYAAYNDHYYSDKAPGLALLGMPVYAAFRHAVPADLSTRLAAIGKSEALSTTLRPDGSGLQAAKLDFFAGLVLTTLVVVAVPSAALGVLFFIVAQQLGLDRKVAWTAALLYTLATSAFPYANAFIGHQTSAALLFSAFAVVFGIRRGALGRRWLFVAGLILTYAAVTEYPTALIGTLLGLYALACLERPIDTFARLALGGIPAVIALAVADYAAFQTILPIGYAHSALWTDVHEVGFFSLTYPKLDALWGLTFGIHRGLFFLSPFLLLALPGYSALWAVRSRRPEFWVLLLAPLIFLAYNASSAMWQGGFAVGPRYLVASLPFLAVSAGFGLDWAWHRGAAWRAILVAAVAWSVFAVWTETLGGQAFPDYTPNPLFDFSLPKLLAGDVARNAGMLLGLRGWPSLIPLALIAVLAGCLPWLTWPGSVAPAHEDAERAKPASVIRTSGMAIDSR